MLSVNGFEVDALRISVDVTSHITQKSSIRMKGRVNLPLAMPYTEFTQPFDRIPELDNTRSWRTLGPPVSPTPWLSYCTDMQENISGLGCVTRALARARFTQPSPHIFLHLCRVLGNTCLMSCLMNKPYDAPSPLTTRDPNHSAQPYFRSLLTSVILFSKGQKNVRLDPHLYKGQQCTYIW